MNTDMDRAGRRRLLLLALAFTALAAAWADDRGEAYVSIDKARWEDEKGRLIVKARGASADAGGDRLQVQVRNAANDALVFSVAVPLEDDGRWQLEAKHRLSGAVPCRVRVVADGAAATSEVREAPADCVDGASNQPPVADAGPDRTLQLAAGQASMPVGLDGSASADPDGSIAAYTWTGSPDPADVVQPQLTLAAGSYRFTLVVQDNAGAASAADAVQIDVLPYGVPVSDSSINSTGQNAGTQADPVSELPAAAVPEQDFINPGGHALLAANDLGMHCADLDYQVFSILPPFNVVHAQVLRKGGEPDILDDAEVEVVYSAVSSPNDPALREPGLSEVFKTNFWDDPDGDGRNLGFDAYAPLYFGLLEPGDIAAADTGLPVPDSVLLRGCLQGYLDGAEGPEGPRTKCGLGQQHMPGQHDPYYANEPVPFDRFDRDINFFDELLGGLGLGAVVTGTNWFAADGVPILPMDDAGRRNAYPLMRVQARSRATGAVLATTDVVLPVASEADCQLCHAPALDCAAVDPGFACAEHGIRRRAFAVMSLDGDANGELPPGRTDLERLLNVAKINILRVHDAKHGTSLDASRPVQCATCHYTPALDLAQLGPMDAGSVSQRSHITMSRAMHGHHGALTENADGSGAPLFPDMPEPVGRSPQAAQSVLQETCYACHPGKRTQCLRGAMAAGGVVCQDCHGDMRHVGNDFSQDLAATPWPDGANLNKRVPWAAEPGCQSCHTGDALDSLAGSNAAAVAADGIRLLKAYTIEAGLDRNGSPDGTEVARPIVASNRRFAEDQTLYRLSKGHGGVMCEGCHGSTHAIFPNPFDNANDNIASKQLQGHAGTIIECSTCHTGDLGNTLEGPHGLHPVGDTRFARGGHEDMAERNAQSCQACHGVNGEGTVLSRTATERQLLCKDDKGSRCSQEDEVITVAPGTAIGCADCHENEIGGGH